MQFKRSVNRKVYKIRDKIYKSRERKFYESTGNLTVNTEPSLGLLSTETVPP